MPSDAVGTGGALVNMAARAQHRLEQMAGLELGWRLHTGELLAWLVTGLALVMSYHAEEDLGQSLRPFHGWPAYVWPLSVDVADVALIVLYVEYKRLRLSTWKVGLGLLAATIVMIAANVRSALPDPTAVLMQAWVPAIALWLWHTLAAGRKPRGAPVDLASVWARLRPEALVGGDATSALSGRAKSAGELVEGRGSPPNRPARVPARAEVRRLLKRHGHAVNAEQVVKRTGVSVQHANKLLRQERQLYVVSEVAASKEDVQW